MDSSCPKDRGDLSMKLKFKVFRAKKLVTFKRAFDHHMRNKSLWVITANANDVLEALKFELPFV